MDAFFIVFALVIVGIFVLVFVGVLRAVMAVFSAVGRTLTGSRRPRFNPKHSDEWPTRTHPVLGATAAGSGVKLCPNRQCQNPNLAAAHYCARCGRRLE